MSIVQVTYAHIFLPNICFVQALLIFALHFIIILFTYTVDECRQRWRSLRDRYVKESRKIRTAPSGSASVDIDEPSWIYFQPLSFLNDSIIPRKYIGLQNILLNI